MQTLNEVKKDIHNWSYYDNYQHGRYVNENDVGYGPIKVFNATVEIDGEEVFGGDISERRIATLRRISKEYSVKVRVYFEGGRDKNMWYTLSKGKSRLIDKRWNPFKKSSTPGIDGLGSLFG